MTRKEQARRHLLQAWVRGHRSVHDERIADAMQNAIDAGLSEREIHQVMDEAAATTEQLRGRRYRAGYGRRAGYTAGNPNVTHIRRPVFRLAHGMNGYVFVFGDAIVRMGDEDMFFRSRPSAVAAAKRQGLAVDASGRVRVRESAGAALGYTIGRGQSYYSVFIPWTSHGQTEWHPIHASGPFSVLTRGAFKTKAEAHEWAKKHLSNTRYDVYKFHR